MTELVIGSLPLQEATLRAYENSILVIKTLLPFERDINKIVIMQAEITQLEILANHTREVISNNQ